MRRDEELNSEEWKTKFIFMGTQLVYTLITMVPPYIFYWNRFYSLSKSFFLVRVVLPSKLLLLLLALIRCLRSVLQY